MSSSREQSPDWLRSFQAPTTSMVSLSSPSKSSSDDSSLKESEAISSVPNQDNSNALVPDEDADKSPKINSKTKSVKKQMNIEHAFYRRKKADKLGNQSGKNVESKEISKNHIEAQGLDHSVLVLTSDSEPCCDSPIKQPLIKATENTEDDTIVTGEGELSVKKEPHVNSPEKYLKKNRTLNKENSAQPILKCEDIINEEETSNKNIKPCISTSTLPLVLSEKINRNKALVECEGDSIDLSGDMGAVGRIVVSDTNQEVYLDLKGTIYRTAIVPSRTFCVVSVGQSEAKIEAIMNDFIQLKPQSNVYEAETMVEGTLEGFSFESEDEGEKKSKAASKPTDQNEGKEEQTKGKAKGKAKNASASGKKRGRPAKEKAQPAKKARKQSTATKRTKAKK